MSVDGRDDELPRPPGLDALEPLEGAARRAESKRRLLEGALERGKTQVRLDARRPGVRVPPHLATDPAVALNLSWRFPDTRMCVNERGVAATLKFGGVPFRCTIPWRAVWGVLPIGDEKVQVWPLDLPVELGGPPTPDDEPEPLPVEGPPLRLVAVRGESAPVEPEAAPPVEAPVAGEPPTEPAPRPRGHLRVVK